ncbi:hypothetical protein FRC08_015982 [Ceratobasidium sp. 394]|nr:hypothetical protein FRC08_015982 [Ceratobasidium sp. 394]
MAHPLGPREDDTAWGPLQPSGEEPRDTVRRPRTATGSTLGPLEPVQPEPQKNSVELLKLGLEDTNKLLVEIGGGLKHVKQTLVVTQQSMARGFNRTLYGSNVGWQFPHTLLNAEGEEPLLSGLPNLTDLQYHLHHGNPVSNSDIAQYLLFYGIGGGGGFIQPGGQPTIKR